MQAILHESDWEKTLRSQLVIVFIKFIAGSGASDVAIPSLPSVLSLLFGMV